MKYTETHWYSCKIVHCPKHGEMTIERRGNEKYPDTCAECGKQLEDGTYSEYKYFVE